MVDSFVNVYFKLFWMYWEKNFEWLCWEQEQCYWSQTHSHWLYGYNQTRIKRTRTPKKWLLFIKPVLNGYLHLDSICMLCTIQNIWQLTGLFLEYYLYYGKEDLSWSLVISKVNHLLQKIKLPKAKSMNWLFLHKMTKFFVLYFSLLTPFMYIRCPSSRFWDAKSL